MAAPYLRARPAHAHRVLLIWRSLSEIPQQAELRHYFEVRSAYQQMQYRALRRDAIRANLLPASRNGKQYYNSLHFCAKAARSARAATS